MKLKIKRIYNQPSKDDGFRILIDRLWPRGVSKERANIDLWMKEIAPSTELRKWFNHDPDRWNEFKEKYLKELQSNTEETKLLFEHIKTKDVTLVFSAKEERYSNAMVLKEFIESYISPDR